MSEKDFSDKYDYTETEDMCAEWDAYYEENYTEESDSDEEGSGV